MFARLVRRPLKLRTRISASFVILLAICVGFLAISLGYLVSKSSLGFYRERGVHITSALAAQAGPLVYYEDLTGLANLLQSQMKAIPDIRYIAVLEPDGRPIWSTFPSGLPADLLAVPHETKRSSEVSARIVRMAEKLLYDYEVRKGQVVVRIGMTLSPVQALNHAIVISAVWIGCGCILAAVLLALYISRPLEALSSAIERAVVLDRRTGGGEGVKDTLETSAIAGHFHDLMARLEERTKQLDAAKKLAYLGEVSATIAHEVNNPLGVLAMNSEFLEDRARSGELTPDAAREVARLRIASRRATLAVQKFLQFARYTTAGGLRPRPAKLPTMVQECVELLGDKIHLARCVIRTDIPSNLPPVMCDGQGLQQVLFNFLTNAVDASPEGGEIVVRASLDGDGLHLQVSDQGKGMSEDELNRATEPFFTTKEEGLGLGLAISHSIVRAHGGTLELRSEAGKGTTATVILPTKGLA
ncbi:MAG: hypothetical protein HYT87_09325 [Nitrospirae bacterium]|nr:hypothetical protein [Nitrospirota bacterium]